MFDVSLSELMVIAVVALIVIGPEKLPKIARMLGHLTGRVQRYVATVKEDINREMQFEDLQKLQQEIKQTVENTQQNLQTQTRDFEASFDQYSTEPANQHVMTGHAANTDDVMANPKKLVKRPRKPRVAKPVDIIASTETMPE